MSDIFHIVGVGLSGGAGRLEAIGLNAASAAVPGYRRHIVVQQRFDAALAAPLERIAHAEPTVERVAPPFVHDVDLARGSMLVTDRPLDLAIDADDAFFALTDGARTWLTKAGSFRLNEDGVLVGEHGLRVVGAQGDVHLPGSDVEVAADGLITHQGVIAGRLQTFRPASRELIAERGALLAAPAGIEPVATAGIRAGTLEASNSDPAREMLALVAISRQFEALTRVAQGYDQLLGRTIETLTQV